MLNQQKKSTEFLSVIFTDIFQISLIIYLLILLIEQFQAGFATNYINLTWILWIIFFSGLLIILLNHNQKQIIFKKIKWWDYFFITAIGLIAGILIYFQIRSFHWIAYIISILSCLMIWLISYIIIKEEQ